jgi:hypothetical protein
MQRRAPPTRIETFGGKKSVPTQAELDQMLFDLVIDKPGGHAAAQAPEPTIPSEAELRDRARELGLPVPPPRPGTAEAFKDDMLRLLTSRP